MTSCKNRPVVADCGRKGVLIIARQSAVGAWNAVAEAQFAVIAAGGQNFAVRRDAGEPRLLRLVKNSRGEHQRFAVGRGPTLRRAVGGRSDEKLAAGRQSKSGDRGSV